MHQGSSGGGVFDTQTGHLLALITHKAAEFNYGTNVKAIWEDAYLHMLEEGLRARAPQLFDALRATVEAIGALNADRPANAGASDAVVPRQCPLRHLRRSPAEKRRLDGAGGAARRWRLFCQGQRTVFHAPSLPCAYLLTGHHVLATPAAAVAAIVHFRYRRVGDLPLQVTPLPNVLFVTNEGLDYTLVAIPSYPHSLAGVVLPACPPARTEAEMEKLIYSLPHPHGSPLHISLAGRRVAAEELDWQTKIAFTSEVHRGSSGGGVYDTQSGHLLALITHESLKYNMGTKVKEIWRDAMQHPDVRANAPQLFDVLRVTVEAIEALNADHARHIEAVALGQARDAQRRLR